MAAQGVSHLLAGHLRVRLRARKPPGAWAKKERGMRTQIVAAALMLGACAAQVDTPVGAAHRDAWPFPTPRGSAIAPPRAGGALDPAPPEGEAGGGLNFGLWRSAEPGALQIAFAAEVRALLSGMNRSAGVAALARNGFHCAPRGQLDCRIEVSDHGCTYDWYVVRDTTRAAPIVRFDKVCLGGARDGAGEGEIG